MPKKSMKSREYTVRQLCRVCLKVLGARSFDPSPTNASGLMHACRRCREEAKAMMPRPRCFRRGPPVERRRPDRYAAQSAVNLAIYRGELRREPCERCGEQKTEAHHHVSYAVEHHLTIMWLCRPCHFEWHKFFGYLP